MKLPLPDAVKDQDTSDYLRKLTGAIQIELDKKLSGESGVASVLLVSPNGSVYNVTVNNAGALTTTLLHS